MPRDPSLAALDRARKGVRPSRVGLAMSICPPSSETDDHPYYGPIYARARAIEADLLDIARRMLLTTLARRRV